MTPTEAIAERDQIGSNKEWRANLRSDIESVDARRSVVIHAKAVLSLLDHIDALEVEAKRYRVIRAGLVDHDSAENALFNQLAEPPSTFEDFDQQCDRVMAALTQAEEKGSSDDNTPIFDQQTGQWKAPVPGIYSYWDAEKRCWKRKHFDIGQTIPAEPA